MPGLTLRPATKRDAGLLLRWRNDPVTRAASRHAAEVGTDEHEAWLDATLANADRELLVVERDGFAVGQIRLDALGPAGEWEISIALDPAARGGGLGARAIGAGLDWLWAERPDARRVVADVRNGNEPSRRAFARAGFAAAGPAPDTGFSRLVAERP